MIKLLKNTFFENAKDLNAHFEKHYHDTYTIGITYQGLLKLDKNNFTTKYYTHSCRVNNPGEVHGGKSFKWSHINFYPSIELLSSIYEQIFFEKKFPIFQQNIIDDKTLFMKLHTFFKLIYGKKSDLQIQTALIDALSYLILHHTTCTKKDLDIFDNKKVIKNSIDFIRAHLDKNITLEMLSQNTHISKYHFLRIFKKEVGLTPHQFILNEKIILANSLIKKGYSLSEAGLSAGFNDQSHFTRNFKKYYGQTVKKGNIILYK